ncbi:MAG: hypothetical protein C5B59_00495 [Bacteroidetes bacterium]|nr:MAG: hypothetical protein C5B59_00495 [Bacteroidota bacterium]
MNGDIVISVVNLTAFHNSGALSSGSFSIPTVTPGNTLVVALIGGASYSTTSITDSAGDTFTHRSGGTFYDPVNDLAADYWFCLHAGAASSISFSATSNPEIWCFELQGTGIFLANNTQANNAGSPTTPTGSSQTGTGFFMSVVSVNKAVTGVNSPWSINISAGGAINGNAVAYMVNSGTQQAVFTEGGTSTDQWLSVSALFSESVTLTVSDPATGQRATDGQTMTLARQITNRVWATGEDQDPSAHYAILNVATAGAWTAGGTGGALPNPSQGTGNGTLRVDPDESQLPQAWVGREAARTGSYTGVVTVRAGTAVVTVNVPIGIGYGCGSNA